MVYINPRNIKLRAKSQGKTSFFNPRYYCHQQGELFIPSKSRVRSHHLLLESNVMQICHYQRPRGFKRGGSVCFCSQPSAVREPSHKVKSVTVKYKPIPVLWVEWPNVCDPEQPECFPFHSAVLQHKTMTCWFFPFLDNDSRENIYILRTNEVIF